ncbi:WYL domain-containing protein, partial [Actinomadura sp. KC06]|uniref:WYL domain-containing protein n=1 Tax=Actinomadura sp. KC06 TaxID=2530369 RepID=UPI001FB62F7D
TGVRCPPRHPPAADAAAFVTRSLAAAGTSPEPRPLRQAVLTVHASAEELADRFRVTGAEIEPVDERTCVLRTTPDSLEWTALRIAYLDLDFDVHGPPDLTARLAAMAARLSRATTPDTGGRTNP